MSGPDNANPTIYASSAAAPTRRTRLPGLDLAPAPDRWDRLQRELTQLHLAAPGSLDVGNDGDDDLYNDDEINQDEVFDLIRSISDPEHPLTLEQLAVVSAPQITVRPGKRPAVLVEFTPTIPHCSMATLIGLSLRVRLLRSLPERFKVDIKVKQGTHQSENAVNKQLNDKERVAAALENAHLLSVVQQCLSTADDGRAGPTA